VTRSPQLRLLLKKRPLPPPPWAILRAQIAAARAAIDRWGLGPVVDVDRAALLILRRQGR
jgi:hypothetical protein